SCNLTLILFPPFLSTDSALSHLSPLSLHDALPISPSARPTCQPCRGCRASVCRPWRLYHLAEQGYRRVSPPELAGCPVASRCFDADGAPKQRYRLWTLSPLTGRVWLHVRRADDCCDPVPSDPGDAERTWCSVALSFWPERELAPGSRTGLRSAGAGPSRWYQCPKWAQTVGVTDLG